MTSFEEAMAVAQASVENSSEEWVRIEEYPLNLEYSEDETVDINIERKTIGDLSANVSTTGEKNSQYIHFMMDRFYDGVDLTSMLIQVQYQYPNGGGNVNGPINVYANDSKIKFGWVIPPEATRFQSIQIMVYCIGVLSNGKPYIVKTLPAVYPIPETLSIEDVSVETDEGWYEQFATSMAEQVRTANEYANQAKDSAQNASDDLEDIQAIKAEVTTSRNTVQTLASQVQTNTVNAKASADAAKVSEQNAKASEDKAKIYADNAQAVTGVNIASKDIAGLVRGGDNLIGEDGELILTMTTTDRTLENSWDGGLRIESVDAGDSEQESTTGAQLLNYEAWKLTGIAQGTGVFENNGVTITATSNDAFTAFQPNSTFPEAAYVAVTEGDIVTVSWEESTNKSGLIYIFGNGEVSLMKSVNNASGQRKLSYTIPSGVTFATFRFGVTNAGDTISYKNIMINKGDTALPWEPYTGGKPSPSASYPQEIESSVVSEITVSGKNLLKLPDEGRTAAGLTYTMEPNGTIAVNGTSTAQGAQRFGTINAKKNKTYIFSGCPQGGSNETYRVDLRHADGNLIDSAKISFGDEVEITAERDEEWHYAIRIAGNYTAKNLVFKPMIREASAKDATFEPYKETTIPLSEPITLHGIGTAKDRVVKQDGVWGVERKIMEVVFDGSSDEAWGRSTLDSTISKTRYHIDLINTVSPSDTAAYAMYCSLAVRTSLYNLFNTQSRYGCAVSGNSVFSIADEIWNGIAADEFKSFLATTPMTLIYKTIPTFEPLSEADQIALHSLVTYFPVTYIRTDSEIEPVIEVEYGTSKVGGHSLEALNTAKRNEIMISSLAAAQTSTEEVTS